MNLKKKMKGFFTLTRKADGGFTLVELIVVIAILAILAGVAVPAYSGYVTRANKQADISLVSDVMYAIELANYSKPGFEGTEMVLITLDGTTVSGGDGSFLDNAMKATFGDGYKSLSLKYGSWGNGAAITADVLAYFSAGQTGPLADVYNGESAPTFANDVDELFVLIRDTAVLMAGKAQNVDGVDIESGADLLKYAAAFDEGAFGELTDFQSAWCDLYTPVGSMAGSGDILDSETFDAETLAPAVATAAVIKARNTSIATYLQNQNPAYAKYYDAIANLGGTIPKDLADVLANNVDAGGKPKMDGIAAELGLADDEDFDMTEFAAAFATAQSYFAVDAATGTSPAQRDAMAYYAMMDTVNHTNASTSGNDDAYWNELSGAVSIYGQIASGKLKLEDVLAAYGSNVPENCVAVLMTADGNEFAIKVNPMYVME